MVENNNNPANNNHYNQNIKQIPTTSSFESRHSMTQRSNSRSNSPPTSPNNHSIATHNNSQTYPYSNNEFRGPQISTKLSSSNNMGQKNRSKTPMSNHFLNKAFNYNNNNSNHLGGSPSNKSIITRDDQSINTRSPSFKRTLNKPDANITTVPQNSNAFLHTIRQHQQPSFLSQQTLQPIPKPIAIRPARFSSMHNNFKNLNTHFNNSTESTSSPNTLNDSNLSPINSPQIRTINTTSNGFINVNDLDSNHQMNSNNNVNNINNKQFRGRIGVPPGFIKGKFSHPTQTFKQ